VFSNKKFCLWFSLAGVAEETKSGSKNLAEVVVFADFQDVGSQFWDPGFHTVSFT
jgi:hypothetical protein